MFYFDTSATTPIEQEVFEEMMPYLTEEYGNPSSKYYTLAITAREAVEKARENVAKLIGAKPEEIIFTSGASESTNMIIKGVADYKKFYECKGNNVITSCAEHKATLNVCKYLNGDIYSNNDATFSLSGEKRKVDRGYNVTFLDVNEYGQVPPEYLRQKISENTVLITLIWGNNEIASLNDIETLSKISNDAKILFHTDATQVIGKYDIDVKKINVDFMSFSAHKFYGPKGVGAAFVKSDDYGLPQITSLIHGGEQEQGLRGSTLAVHDIVGFGKAAEIALRDKEKNKNYFRKSDEEIMKIIKNVSYLRLIGDPVNRIPGIYSVVVDKKDFNNERFFKNFQSEFALSSGSACNIGQPSHVLKSIGLGDYTNKVIRISIGKNNSLEIIDGIELLIKKLNNYS